MVVSVRERERERERWCFDQGFGNLIWGFLHSHAISGWLVDTCGSHVK